MSMNQIEAAIVKSFDPRMIETARDWFEKHELVVEGANGSIGTGVAVALNALDISPSKIILTTQSSPPSELWTKNFQVLHFQKIRRQIKNSSNHP